MLLILPERLFWSFILRRITRLHVFRRTRGECKMASFFNWKSQMHTPPKTFANKINVNTGLGDQTNHKPNNQGSETK